MIENVYRCLKPGRFFALNVHNYRYFTDFEERSIELAERVGFSRCPDRDLKMVLSPIMGARKFRKEEERFEPIYLFQKDGS